ncbi:thiamine ABC transporter substrate-binding protein [Natrarchaeobius halalkaliphilus]|uniref:Thiamine ABC transporter substrate-binding protein n=1 Tax=Natrarchaeobius halalkaliphilus TaxID=1679091 RepID=A0A3N6MQT0_9EURY|nr:thiamine ABC transporter substrate-binding protein [Natrarchaeobius halalkaliphilus]RQG86179.1 thiamine ABC transporter substrate-binding protein [Natrarchaeobius halalkaliphilus]
MRRRTFVGAIGGGATLGFAGCVTRDDENGGNGGNGSDDGSGSDDPADGTDDSSTDSGEDELSGTLEVVTYESMIDGENPAGPWLKDAFEDEYPDVELEWTLLPDGGINHYIQRADQGADIDPDVYLGLNIDDLVTVDDNLADGGLFQELDTGAIEHADRIRDGLDMGDPHGRALAYDTGYISLVYDESEVDAPETFDDLTEPEYEDALLAQNAQTSDPGQAFLLWTIDAFGEDGYLDYWGDLEENGVRVLEDWTESYYGAYMEEERPMVVSYSTDQVFAVAEGNDMTRHQIAFPNDQGYANPEGMAIFDDSESADLAAAFFDFVLSNEPQAEIAQRNVQFPAVDEEYVDLDEEFDEYAHVPLEAVTVGYDQLRGNLDGWVDDWAREFASQ